MYYICQWLQLRLGFDSDWLKKFSSFNVHLDLFLRNYTFSNLALNTKRLLDQCWKHWCKQFPWSLFYMNLPLLHFFVGEEKSSIIFYLYALYFMGLYNLHIPVYCLSRGSGMVMVFPLEASYEVIIIPLWLEDWCNQPIDSLWCYFKWCAPWQVTNSDVIVIFWSNIDLSMLQLCWIELWTLLFYSGYIENEYIMEMGKYESFWAPSCTQYFGQPVSYVFVYEKGLLS